MSDAIGARRPEQVSPAPQHRRLIPLRVGDAVVFIEQVGESPDVMVDDQIYPVAPVQQEAFEQAGQVIDECVRTIGARVKGLASEVKPREVTVEFTISFEATTKAQIIPLLVTGGTKVNTGLKVTAVWGSEKDG